MKVLPALLIAASVLLSGCVEHEVVVERRGPPPGPPGPPPLIVETQGYAPYPGAVWVRGHYYWRRNHWFWHRGHWR